jgi:hypothetical protein
LLFRLPQKEFEIGRQTDRQAERRVPLSISVRIVRSVSFLYITNIHILVGGQVVVFLLKKRKNGEEGWVMQEAEWIWMAMDEWMDGWDDRKKAQIGSS